MGRPVTLFTGQWAVFPSPRARAEGRGMGPPRSELACWGDHFEVDKAVADAGYASLSPRASSAHGSDVWALGAHLVGQAVCDPVDERHRGILPPDVFGDGDPEGARQRAAEWMGDTARAAAALGVLQQVNGFTGSSAWHLFYSFPPTNRTPVERGYADFAERWGRILDVFHCKACAPVSGPSHRDRLRLRHHPQDARRG